LIPVKIAAIIFESIPLSPSITLFLSSELLIFLLGLPNLFPLIVDLLTTTKTLSYELSSLKNDIGDMALEIKQIKDN
jgi:uncharacterized membrane protein